MLSADGFGLGAVVADAGARLEIAAEPADFSTEPSALIDGGDTEIFGDADMPIAMADETVEATWIDATGGDWADSANWQDGHVPVAGDDVVITGLNEDAVITLTGDTPELGSLAIESGEVTIDGGLKVGTLTMASGATLNLVGTGSSAITGEVTVSAGAVMTMSGTASLVWSSGGTWAHHGDLTMEAGTVFQSSSSGAVQVYDGLFQIDAGATARVTDYWGNFFVDGGELRVNGTLDVSGGNAEFIEYAGTISGVGTIATVRAMYLYGTVNPGDGAGGTGTLTLDGSAYFRSYTDNPGNPWSLHLDILDEDSADRLVVTGTAELNAHGTVTLDASAADFGDTATGTLIGTDGNLVSLDNPLTTPIVAITAGAEHTVTSSWDGGNGVITVETFSPINVTWINAAGGNWSDTANWANGRLPAAGENVTITGLDEGAVITVDGLDLNLGNLSLDNGQLVLTNDAALNLAGTDVLTLVQLSLVDSDLTLADNAVATISGDVSVDTTSEIALSGSAQLTQSGGTWTLAGGARFSAAGTAAFTQNAGVFESNDTSDLAFTESSTWTISGGEYRLGTTATSGLSGAAALTISGGTITFIGSGSHLQAAALIEFTAGTIAGYGALSANGGINVAGTISPSSNDGTTGWIQLGGAVNFTGGWEVHLDVLDVTTTTSASMDFVSINGDATFGGTGEVVLDASGADFGAAETGTRVGDANGLFYVTGTATGAPTIRVVDGVDHTVVGTWNAGAAALATETFSPLTVAWTNAAGGNWSDAANWANGRLPTAGETVTITGLDEGAVVTIDGITVSLGAVAITGDVVIHAGSALTSTDFDVAGDLTVDGDSTLNLTDGAPVLAGDLSVAAGSTVAVSGDTAVTWDGENATINGTLALTNTATLGIDSGRFELATGSTVNFKDSSQLNLSGGTLAVTAGGLVDFFDNSVFQQTGGTFAMEHADADAALSNNATWNLSGGLATIVTDATLRTHFSPTINHSGGELRLLGGRVGVTPEVGFSETVYHFTGGTLSGFGTLWIDNDITLGGTIAPGVGEGGTGSLVIDSYAPENNTITFTGTWAVELDINAVDTFDSLQLIGDVTWGGTGAITLDASGADFTGVEEGTAIADIVSLTGSVVGDAADLQITAGDDVSVTANWDGTTLAVATVGGVPADNSGSVVANGLSASTSTFQGMLDDFDLSGATFSILSVPSALADLFDLGGISDSLALPDISGATDLESTVTALRNAGYTVDTTVDGTDLVATLTRTVVTDRPVAGGFVGDTFAAAAEILAGLADEIDLDATLSLLSSLVQHIVFELRDGVFNLLSDSYLALTIVGGATVTGSVRHGGRTVSASGSTTINTEVRLRHADTVTAVGQGTNSVSLSFTAGPVELDYGITQTLTADHAARTTAASTAVTLGGTLTLEGLTDTEGEATELSLTGTLGEGGDSWSLSGAGSNVQWLNFTVTGWSFDIAMSEGLFNGSGTFSTDLDFLADAVGSAPSVDLTATFDQDELSFTGTFSTDLIAVANPAGGTYLAINDFASTVNVTGNLDSGAWTGSLTFSGGESTFGPDGSAFTASITDGDDADSIAVEGSYDFSTQAFSTSVDQFELVAENIVRLTAAGVTLRHQRDVTDEQELLAAETVTLELLFLTSAPSTGPPTAEAADLSIRTNGITIGAGSLSMDEIDLGSALSLTGVALSFNGFSFLDGTVSSDSVTLTADAAELFPEGDVFSAAATNLEGTYDFSADDDRLGLSADTLTFGIEGLVEFDATDIVIRPEGDLIFSAETIAATLIPFDLSGEISGLQIASDGTPSAISFTVDTSGLAESLELGGMLPLEITGIDVAFHGDANANGTRDEGETFRLDAFDLTIAGTFDFGVLDGLPFTPVIQVGEETFEDGTDEFAVTLRSVAGTFQIWETESITIGVADLQIGNLFEIAGSIILGGYSEGEWVGAFAGNLVITSLNDTVTGNATATVSGSVDVDAGTVVVETAATLDLGIGSTIMLSEAALSTDFTIAKDESGDLTFAINTASASVGTLSVGSVFAATNVTASLDNLEISGAGVTLGSISFSAASATILPDNDLGVTATTTGFSGSYDFTTDPDTFILTADAVSFGLADKVSFEATGVSLTPTGETLFSIATISASLPGLGVDGEVTGFQLAANGTPSATSVLLDTSGLADSLGLGGVLPFNVDTIALNPPGEGERIEFDNFDLTVAGTIDFSGLDNLPFTPTVTIDGQTSRSDDETAAEFSFTVRLDDGEIQIWDTPTITLGLEELQIGELLEIDGSVTLGGYTDGVWGGDFGGSLTVTSLNEKVTGSAAATVTGSVDVTTGTITVFTEATLDLGIGTDVVLTTAVASVDFTITDDETDGLVLAIDEANLAVGTLAVGSIIEAADVSATLADLTISGAGVSLGSISFSAASATLLPENELGITAETTGVSGSYDFSTDPDTFELTAESVAFELADVVSFNAAGVSLTPLGAVVLAVDSADATLAGLGSSAAVTGFELAADGTPSATSIELDTAGLTESLELGGLLPLDISAIALAGNEEGERITFTDFDLTVEGTINFSVFGDLPFTPYITIGEQTTRSDDETAAEFSFTVRMEDSALQILDSPTITLGLEDLRFGDVLEIDGSITLGGYTDGAWVGAFGGSLTLTALQIPAGADGAAPTSITVDVSGLHDADAGTLQMNIATAISFGLGEDISFVDAGIEVDFTLRNSEEDGLELMDLGVTATAGSMTVGAILTAQDVSVGFSGFSVTADGIALGAVQLSAGAAALFPDSTAFTATVTDFSGSYDFTADSDPFELEAAAVDFEVIDLLSFNATDVVIRPASEVIVSIGSIAVELPGVGVGGSVTGFELTSDGTPSAVALTLDTSGLVESLPLAGVLPFELDSIAATFLGDTNANGVRDEGEIFRLDAFDLSVEGAFNFAALSALPFTPVLRIGDTEADDGEDTFSFTVRVVDGTITPWDLGPITIGVSDLNVGTAFGFSGSITLGGYAEGEWVPDFGGSLELTAASSTGNLSGTVSAELTGSIDVETGVLDIDAAFAVSFTLGSYVEVENAGISLSLTIATAEGESGSVTLAEPVFTVHSASVERISVNFNNLVELEATAATFNFEATGEEILLSVGTLSASLTGIGISGSASNFAVAANGGLVPQENFSVSFSFGETASGLIQWPEWMPIEVSVFELAWPDLAADPLDFTLRLSAAVGIDSLKGTELSLYGSIEGLVIDVGALKAGAFPIIELGTVELSVSGKISSAEVSAGLILGMVRLDADGNQIADDDTTTEVADGLLWGAIRGGINIAGYGGFEIFLGLSEYGPLQGYIKLTVPLTIPYVGIAFTDFRAGITFNSALPSIEDPLELQDHPEFTPTGNLTFGEWSELLKGALATQIEAHAEAGNFGVLLSPFTIEGGVTIFSIYASTASFNIQADFKMDSTGKFLARGAFQLGGTISFTANLYIDMSTFITEGDGTVMFLAELPSELPVATIYGLLSFDFGETVDPDNPPAAPFEQFTIRLEGGARMEIAGIPGFVLEGSVAFEVALNAPSLHIIVDGRAALPGLGDVVGLAGDFRMFFGEDETIELAGILALTPADFSQLESIGVTMDAVALLRFNTTSEAIDYTLTIAGQSEPRTFTVAAGEASILVEGVLGLAPAGIELFRLGGLFSMTFSEYGFDVIAAAELTAGPMAAPLLRFNASGYLHLEVNGIVPGMAAQLTLELDADDDVLAAIGVELEGNYQFIMNTTGEDVDFALPTELAAISAVDRIHLPRGPPSADGESIGAAGSYLIVRADGVLNLLDVLDLEGVFDFQVSDGEVQLDYEATVRLGVGDITFYQYDAQGVFRIDAAGIYGQADLTIDASAGLPALALGFSFDATYQLQLNTTNADQTLGDVTLAAGNYARVRADGALVVGAWRFVGTYDLIAAADGVSAQAAGSVSLGVGDVEFASFDFAGTLLIRDDGIFAQLALSQSRSAPTVYGFGFSADAGYELSLNTTGEEIDGVAAGLGARIVVTGALEIGNWQIEGVYTLNATTTGIGFAASAALIFKAGDDELFRVPLEFEITLEIPGIVEKIELALSLEDLGITIPGLELSGAAQVLINTTADAQDGIPAGPILQFNIEGQAVIGGLALDGSFAFESTLGGVTMTADFASHLGPTESPLLSFTGAGEFELTLLGVAGYMELALTDGVPDFLDFFDTDFNFFIEANTRAVPYTLGERELPAGPSVRIGATGTLRVAGVSFGGSYTLGASLGGVEITMDATASVALPAIEGGEFTLISFAAEGGLFLGLDGLVAALEVTPDVVDFGAVGLSINTDVAFALRINTTGEAQTVGGIELEAGNYARVSFTSSLTYGIFHFEGFFSLSVVDHTAELLVDSELVAILPGIGGANDVELFRMNAQGGIRIAPEGVVAAIELDRGALDQLSLLDVRLPIGLSQTFVLHLNTTGEAATLGEVELEAGRYAKIVTTGEIEIGPVRLTGLFNLSAGETGLAMAFDADVFLGVPGTEVSLIRWHAQGGFQIKANGVAGAFQLHAAAGLAGLETIGLDIETLGQDVLRIFRINTTGEEIEIGDLTLEAGHYIEVVSHDSFSIGLARIVGTITFRLGGEGLLIDAHGEVFFGIPGGDLQEDVGFKFNVDAEFAIVADGIYGRAAIEPGLQPLTVAGVNFTPDVAVGPVFTVNTTEADKMVDGDTIRAGSINLAMRVEVSLFEQSANYGAVFTIDFERQVIAAIVQGRVELSVGDWTPFSYNATGIILIAADGVAIDLSLALDAGDGIPGLTANLDWGLRASTFTGPTTIEGFTIGNVIVPTLVFDSGGVFRVGGEGTLEIGGLLFDGSFFFAITDGPGLFDVALTLSFDATLKLEVGDITLMAFEVVGGLSVSVNGIWGGIDLELPSSGLDAATLGFSLEATYRMEINTTGAAQTVGELELPAGPYARVQGTGDMIIGALRMTGTYGFSVGADSVLIDSTGSVALGVAGITFYRYDYDGQFALDASGLYANLSLTVGSTNRDQFGFGFSADATYTLGINTTHTERDGVSPGLGARVRVEGNLEIGDISVAGVYDLTASTTGIGFAASAALVLRTDDTVLLEVPLEFNYELEIPGIVDEIALDIAAEDLGIDIPGLDFAGEAAIVINTTGTAQGDIPAGPLLQLAVNGTATVGDLDLSGRFGFESSLNRTRMITEFSYTLGDASDPLLSFGATGAFNLGLDGIAGIFDLEITGGDESIRELLGNDLTYNLVVNTTGSEYELFDQTLPAGPLYQVEAHGDLAMAGLTLSGDYIFRIDGAGLLVDTQADLDLSIPMLSGDDIRLFSFEMDGGLAITKDGIATALELTPSFASLDAFGFTLGPDASYHFAVNTTGQAFTFGDAELEAGVYARVESQGSMSFGIATMTGLFRFEADTAGVFEMQAVAELEMAVPGVGELLRFSQSGGFRFDHSGVTAAMDLERSLASDRLTVGGITLPFTAEQSFLLRVNTTGEAREIAGVELEAGNYFAIDSVGELDLGIARGIGEFTFLAGDGQMDIELVQSLTLGIPGTEIELYSFNMTGGLNISGEGVYGALGLSRQLGLDGLESVGISFDSLGTEDGQWILVNTTGEVRTVGERELAAGSYIEFENTGAMNFGVLRTEGVARIRAGSEGFVAQVNGVQFLGLPAVGDFDGLTLFEAGLDAEFNITGDGVWGYAQLTQTRESISVGGVDLTPDFAGGVYLQLNTTNTERTVDNNVLAADAVRIAGTMDLSLLGSRMSGQTIITVDWAQGYGALAFEGTVDIGIGDWRPFSYDASGFILVGEAGAVANFDLTLNGGAGVPGIDFNGTWSMRASTMSEAVTVAAFTAGGLEVPEITIEAGNMLRTHMSGSVTALGGLTVQGEFDLAANSIEFSVYSQGTVSFFGATASFDGRMYIHSDRGFVANLLLDWGGIDNAFMEISGQAFLRINTWDGVWEDVTPNTYEVGINDATLRLGFTELTGWGAFQWVDGEARMWVDMNATLLPGMDGHFDGFVSSAGVYDLNGSFNLAMGDRDFAGAFGTLQANLNHETGVTGTVSGDIYVPGGDYGHLSGSFALTETEARLTVDETAFVLLGGLVRIDAAFEVVLSEGILSLYLEEATAALRLPGYQQSLSVNGWLNSRGEFDLSGNMELDFGTSVLGIAGTVALNISHQGINGAVSGRVYVPGDYGNYTGTFAANSTGFVINGSSRFVLVGGLVLLDGSFEFDTRGSVTLRIQNMAATSRIPGLNAEFRLSGWANSAGQFDLTGEASISFGSRSVLGFDASLAINVTHEGFFAAVDGRVYFPGSSSLFKGSLAANSDGFVIEVSEVQMHLPGNFVILRGALRMEIYNGGSSYRFYAENMAVELRLLGFNYSVNLSSAYFRSDGYIEVIGSTRMNFGSSTLGADASVEFEYIRNPSGSYSFAGDAAGRIYFPGSTSTFNGTIRATSTTFDLEVSDAALVLPGSFVVLRGGLRIGIEGSSYRFYVNNMTAELRIPGFESNTRVSGYLRSDGYIELSGSAEMDYGTSVLGVAASVDFDYIRRPWGAYSFTGNLSGIFYAPGDTAGLNGSIVADNSGFDIEASTRFVLLGGLVLLDGGVGLSYRGGTLTARFDAIVAEMRIPGFTPSLTIDGWINSGGEFDLSGSTSTTVGNRTLGAEFDLNVRVQHTGIRGDFSGQLFVPGDWTNVSGSFEAGSWGFLLDIDRARFSLLGGLVIVDGSGRLELRDGTFNLWVNDAGVTIAGIFEGSIGGFIRSDGFFDLDGSASLQLGHWSTVEISGDMRINIRSDQGVRAWANAAVYVLHQQVASLSDAFTYIGRDGFGMSVSVNFTHSDLRISTTLNLEVRSDGLQASLRGSASLWGFSGSVSGWFDSRNGTWRMDGDVGFSVGGTVGASGRIEFDVGHDRFRFYARGEAWAGFRVYWWHPTPKWYDWFRGHWDSEWVGGSVDFHVGLDVNSGTASVSVAGRSVHLRFKGGFRVWLSNVGGSTVFLDVNRNGTLDEGEPWTLADEEGNFSFDNEAEEGSSGEATVITLEEALGELLSHDVNGNGIIDEEEGVLYVSGGTDVANGAAGPAGVALESGLASGTTSYAGATVFLDTNGNSVRDDDEPSVTTDDLGIYAFGASDAGSPWLGALADFDRNGDGQLNEDEIQLYAVNGLVPVSGDEVIRLFRDANGDGTWQDGETFAFVTLNEMSVLGVAAASGETPDISNSPLAVFDADGDGVMEEAEGQGLVATDPVEVRTPLTPISPFASGTLPVADAEYVFADINGNGVWDADEPRVTPNEIGFYTFVTEDNLDETSRLGRLAPFDTNGNGEIDASEGVFVIQGGTDNDNGVANPVAATGLASGYGGGVEQTISPLSSLQVALVDLGLSEDEADDMIVGALGLPGDIDINTFNPIAETSGGDGSSENAALGVGAALTTLVTGGASLLGGADNGVAQDAVLNSIAELLVTERNASGEGFDIIDLSNPTTLGAVLADAASDSGMALDADVVAAAAAVIATVNEDIAQDVAAGGSVDRVLAATKAVVLTNVNASLGDLVSGELDPDEIDDMFTDEAIDDLAAAVELTPTVGPIWAEMENLTVAGGDQITITLPVSDQDSALRHLRFSVTSSDGSVVDPDDVDFVLENGVWSMVIATGVLSSGATELTLTANDGEASATSSFTLNLDGLNPVVQLEAPVGNRILTSGESITLDLTDYFDDPDNNATYALRPVGTNATVDAAIVDGQVVLTARSDLSGLAVFDLVASDDRGSVSTRFSVVTYPNVAVSDTVRYTSTGEAEIDVVLSNPSTQALTLRYNLAAANEDHDGQLTGVLRFGAGETTQTLVIDLAATGFGDVGVNALAFGVRSGWATGAFDVTINNRNPVELLDLQRRVNLTFEFTLVYDFIAEATEDDALLGSMFGQGATETVVEYGAPGLGASVAMAAQTGANALVAATSLEALERPRTLVGI